MEYDISAFKTEPFHVDLLCLLFLITIFANDRLRLTIRKQVFIVFAVPVFDKRIIH